jgi:3-oxoadipate enol-lactonase
VAAGAEWLLREIADVPGPLVLVGHGLGAALCLEAALRAPDAVEGLVVLSAGARLPVPDGPEALAGLLHADADDEQRGRTERAVAAAGAEVMAADLEAAAGVDLTGRLDEVRAPVLVLGGDRDELIPVALVEQLAEGLPQVLMAVLPGAGHLLQVERPGTVNLLIAAYLARLELSLG